MTVGRSNTQRDTDILESTLFWCGLWRDSWTDLLAAMGQEELYTFNPGVALEAAATSVLLLCSDILINTVVYNMLSSFSVSFWIPKVSLY